jgi:predicted nucleotidyltransferase
MNKNIYYYIEWSEKRIEIIIIKNDVISYFYKVKAIKIKFIVFIIQSQYLLINEYFDNYPCKMEVITSQ